jgi:hypothetical protein
MTLHRIKADRLSRQAWMMLGKAREIRFAASNGWSGNIENVDRMLIAHNVRTARMSMHTAILYRQMEGRL